MDSIYEGIDNTGVVILVVSKSSVESGWVNREINAAFSKEDQLKRTFLIPIKIDDCPAPIKVADRLYADFTKSFSEPLMALARILEQKGAKNLPVAPEKELLAVRFTKEVNLDKVLFIQNLDHIRRRHPTLRLTSSQLVVSNDEDYDTLRSRLFARLDDVANEPKYSPHLEEMLRSDAQTIVDNEERLSKGLALIVNERYPNQSAYWFAKILRGRMVYNLWRAQNPVLRNNLSYGESWSCADLISGTAACEFFEEASNTYVDVFPDEAHSHEYFHIAVSENIRERLLDKDGAYTSQSVVSDIFHRDEIEKYLYPQMVLYHLQFGTPLLPNVWRSIVGLS